MSTCPACGGVIGRDCFNPQECMEITRSMAEAHQSQPDHQGEIARLENQLEELIDAVKTIRDTVLHNRHQLAESELEGNPQLTNSILDVIDDNVPDWLAFNEHEPRAGGGVDE